MTLRLRLVIAITVLVAVGLATFGVVTYALYSRSLYDRTDDQLRSSVNAVATSLFQEAGLGGFPGRDNDHRGGPSVVVPPGTYAELRGSSGEIESQIQLSNASSLPELPAQLPDGGPNGTFSTVGSSTGSGDWRLLVVRVNTFGPDASPMDVAIAIPLKDVEASLNRLVAIEVAAAFGLLAVLALGSWLILRRGLHPLEQMATTAGSITAGALDQRVEPDDGRTEVGKLGLALNTMLGELERAFQEREATEQRLRQFLADASHELRTPLTSIRGFAELFRLGPEHDQVSLEVMMRRIEEESARMKTLVDDLLLLARLDETRPVEQTPVDLAVLAADACTDAVAVAPDRPITLVAPEPLVVLGERDHLHQAIANIVSNALKYTPPASPIEVVAARTDGQATVAVRDHGPGLTPEALEHVFDRFWQADGARVGWGAGLGLSIVAAIAEEHGGTATARNADDGGAVFTISLPLGAQAETAAARPAEVGSGAPDSQEVPREL